MIYDVIISGSGPAGAIAAKVCAKSGLKTLMLERHPLKPRFEKPCGGGIPNQVFEDFNIPTRDVIEQRINGSTVFAPNGDKYTIEVPGEPSGWNVKRSVFDKYLCDDAVKTDLEVLEKAFVFDILTKDQYVIGVKARHDGQIKDFKSNLTIAADGVGSKIVLKAGLRKKWDPYKDLGKCAVAFVSNYNLANNNQDEHYNQFYLSNEIAPNAYSWMFPLADNVVNIGLGIHRMSSLNPMKYFSDTP